MVRKNRGRQKIEIKKIEKQSNLQVTFSKRKFGVFKKASELCTLCGVKILMIVFSPSGKVYSFGNPNVYDFINWIKFRNFNDFFYPSNNNLQLAQMGLDPHIQSLNDQLTEERAKQDELQKDKKILIEIQEKRKEKGNWWEKDPKDMNLDEIKELTPRLQDLTNVSLNQIMQHSHQNVSQNYFGGEMLNNNVVPTNMFGAGNFNGGFDYVNQGEMTMSMQNPYDHDQNIMLPMHNGYNNNNNNNQNMIIPNYHVPSFGYDNNNINNNIYPPNYNFNQG